MARRLKKSVKIILGLVILAAVAGILHVNDYVSLNFEGFGKVNEKVTGLAVGRTEQGPIPEAEEVDKSDFATEFSYGAFGVNFSASEIVKEGENTYRAYLDADAFMVRKDDGSYTVVNKYKPKYDVACVQDCNIFCDANQMEINERTYSQKWGRCLCRCDASQSQ